MSEPITYVGIDAHKVELHVALLAPDASAPVTWKVQNETRAVERLRRKLEKAAPGPAAPGPVACCYEAGAVRLCIAAAARPVSGAGGLVALFPGHRHADRDAAARRAARCAAGRETSGSEAGTILVSNKRPFSPNSSAAVNMTRSVSRICQIQYAKPHDHHLRDVPVPGRPDAERAGRELRDRPPGDRRCRGRGRPPARRAAGPVARRHYQRGRAPRTAGA